MKISLLYLQLNLGAASDVSRHSVLVHVQSQCEHRFGDAARLLYGIVESTFDTSFTPGVKSRHQIDDPRRVRGRT